MGERRANVADAFVCRNRRLAGKQVLLRVRPAKGESREVIVQPISLDDAGDLRYAEWQHTRRLAVERRDRHVGDAGGQQDEGLHGAIRGVRGRRIVTLDADLQNPPEEIGKLLARMDEGYDYVGGVRVARRDSLFRRAASRMMNGLRERITNIRLTDQGCMLRAYSRDIVAAINECREVNTFIPALAYTFAQNPAEVDVAHEARAAGESKYSLYKLIHLNFDLVTGFSLLPLQLFAMLGIVLALGSVGTYLFVMLERILFGAPGSAWQILWDRDILEFFLIGIVLYAATALVERRFTGWAFRGQARHQ